MPNELRRTLDRLIEANQAYRNATPIMEDSQYDALEDRLAELICDVEYYPESDLAAARAFLDSIGSPPPDTSGWMKVRHDAAMTSLNKAQNATEATAWSRSVGAGDIVISEKMDGISCQIKYLDGNIVRAATRGDGETGEDITRNVVRMKGVVRNIRGFSGHVRGEIVLRRSDHAAHFLDYANPRNAAAGVAKRLDGVGVEHLTFYAYQIVRDAGATPIRRKQDELTVLGRLGFFVPQWQVVSSIDDAIILRDNYDRSSIDYDIDGLVLEVDDLEGAAALGELNHRPKGAIAYKFSHMTAETILREVTWQVGKSGRITPVAVFDPVMLAGARIERASLATPDRVTRMRLSKGCRILVSRRNDVIPYLEKNLDEDITND
jgi:DNA ligase (NAD+)